MSECVYSEGKASQDRRRLESAISTIKVYKELLQDISHTVDTPTSLRITNAIKVCHGVAPVAWSLGRGSR